MRATCITTKRGGEDKACTRENSMRAQRPVLVEPLSSLSQNHLGLGDCISFSKQQHNEGKSKYLPARILLLLEMSMSQQNFVEETHHRGHYSISEKAMADESWKRYPK
jgi:hypothetical protein